MSPAYAIVPTDSLDAPRPWRAVPRYSEISAVVDAQSRSLFVCRAEIATLVVEIVNRDKMP